MQSMSSINNMDIYDYLEENFKNRIDNLFKDIDTYQSFFGIKKREQAKLDVKRLQDMKRLSIGNKTARTYVINQYLSALIKVLQISDDELSKVIDFDNLINNDIRVLFELLLEVYDMSELINKYHITIRMTEKKLMKIVKDEEDYIKKKFYTWNSRVRILATILYTINDGKNLIDTLTYHAINEVGIRDKDYIYIIYKGKKIHLEFLKFNKTNIIKNIQYKASRNASLKYDESNPTVTTTLDNSNRITIAGYSAVPSSDYWYYNERIFNLGAITLEELKDALFTIDQQIYDLLMIHINGRGSHLVSGSDMGVGKTTFLTAMIEKIPDYWGIGILDSQDEIQAQIKFPQKNIKPLIENPYRTIGELFQQMLKMSRDIEIVGEIVKSEHMAEMMNAALRLNAGVGGTIHLRSPYESVTNCVNLLMRTSMYDNSKTAEKDVARAIDLVIHLAKLPEGRIVVENIVEIEYIENRYFIEAQLSDSRTKRISNLINMAQLALQKYLFPYSFRFREIIKYNRQEDRWIVMNYPSDNYFNKLTQNQHITFEDIETFKKNFKKEKSN